MVQYTPLITLRVHPGCAFTNHIVIPHLKNILLCILQMTSRETKIKICLLPKFLYGIPLLMFLQVQRTPRRQTTFLIDLERDVLLSPGISSFFCRPRRGVCWQRCRCVGDGGKGTETRSFFLSLFFKKVRVREGVDPGLLFS